MAFWIFCLVLVALTAAIVGSEIADDRRDRRERAAAAKSTADAFATLPEWVGKVDGTSTSVQGGDR